MDDQQVADTLGGILADVFKSEFPRLSRAIKTLDPDTRVLLVRAAGCDMMVRCAGAPADVIDDVLAEQSA